MIYSTIELFPDKSLGKGVVICWDTHDKLWITDGIYIETLGM